MDTPIYDHLTRHQGRTESVEDAACRVIGEQIVREVEVFLAVVAEVEG